MSIRVVEIHHPALRIEGGEEGVRAHVDFYEGVLGLAADGGRPTLPGIPGAWINVGAVGQLHLIGGEQPSRLAKGPGQDPTSPHVALAVADIVEAKADLQQRGITFWSVTGVNGPQAEQLFLRDPSGNMIELHQVDQCRCRQANRR